MKNNKIIYYALVIIFIASLAVWLLYGEKLAGIVAVEKESQISAARPDIASKHSVCLGEKDPDYDLGFGIKHTYEGNINNNSPVSVTLSCDHQEFVITGAISQVIRSEDLKDYFEGEIIDLVDASVLKSGVTLDKDYNFDGYNDLVTITTYGQGYEGVTSYAVFLFDQVKKQFIYNTKLSSITNLELDSISKQFISKSCSFNNERTELSCDTVHYKWKDGDLVKEKTTTQIEE